MPKEITAGNGFVTRLTVPRDGENIDAGDVNAPFQDLLNNTAFLRAQLAALAARLEKAEQGESGFNLAAPQNLTLEPGRTYAFPDGVSIGRFGGYAQTVDVDVLNLPAGVSAGLNPDPVPAGELNSDLTLTVAANAVPGPATLTVRAVGADGQVREVLMPVTVAAQTLQSTFTLSAGSAVSIDRTHGASTGLPIGVNRTGNFGADIQFSVTGLPAGVTAAFNPATVAGSAAYQQAATTLTLTADAAVPAGTYSVQVRAVSGSIVRTLGVTLKVTAPAAQAGSGDYTLSVTYDQGDPRNINGATITINRTGGFDGPVSAQFSETVYSSSGVPAAQRPVVLLNGVASSAQSPAFIQVDGGTFRVSADGTGTGWRGSGITSALQGLLGDEVLITTYATVNGQFVERSVTLNRRYGTRSY